MAADVTTPLLAPRELLQDEEGAHSAMKKAAYLIDKVLVTQLVPLEVIRDPNCSGAEQAFIWFNRLFYVRFASRVALIALPFFERPEWCSEGMAGGRCEETSKYLLSGTRYLSSSRFCIIEFLSVLPLALSLYLKSYYKISTFWNDWTTMIKVGLLIAMALHMICSVFEAQSSPVILVGKRMGPYLCIAMVIIFSRSLRTCFYMTMHISQTYIDTAALLATFMLISAWLASLLFSEPNFQDFSTSLLNLLVMMTTANNPNVWAATYEKNHWSFTFFFGYMAFTFFFLMPLLFSLLYNNYKVQLILDVQKLFAIKKKNLYAAFKLLRSSRTLVSLEDASNVFLEIGKYRELEVPDTRAIVSNSLAAAGIPYEDIVQDGLVFDKFQLLCTKFIQAVEAKVLQQGKPPPGRVHRIQSFSRLDRLLRSTGYKCLSFTISLVSMIVAIFVQSIRDPEHPDITHPVSSKVITPSLETLTKCEFVLGWIFLAELACRILEQGIREYVRRFRNYIDFFATLSVVTLQISTIWYPHAHKWISVSIIMRSIQCLAVLGYVKRWRGMGHAILDIVPEAGPILCFQFCVCLMFSAAGVDVFGGLVFKGNPLIEATEYATSGLWVYNYNDQVSAIVTSFNLCIVNNWYVIMDGYAAASETKWSRAYFIIFWAIAVMFTLNVVVAFYVGKITAHLGKAESHESSQAIQRTADSAALPLRLDRMHTSDHFFRGYSGEFSM